MNTKIDIETLKKKDPLLVPIPIRFKTDLDNRFNPEYAEETIVARTKNYMDIKVPCMLCKEYYPEVFTAEPVDYPEKCTGCPFQRFQGTMDDVDDELGCMLWMLEIAKIALKDDYILFTRNIIISPSKVHWLKDIEKSIDIKKIFSLFREEATNHIIWIEDSHSTNNWKVSLASPGVKN